MAPDSLWSLADTRLEVSLADRAYAAAYCTLTAPPATNVPAEPISGGHLAAEGLTGHPLHSCIWPEHHFDPGHCRDRGSPKGDIGVATTSREQQALTAAPAGKGAS